MPQGLLSKTLHLLLSSLLSSTKTSSPATRNHILSSLHRLSTHPTSPATATRPPKRTISRAPCAVLEVSCRCPRVNAPDSSPNALGPRSSWLLCVARATRLGLFSRFFWTHLPQSANSSPSPHSARSASSYKAQRGRVLDRSMSQRLCTRILSGYLTTPSVNAFLRNTNSFLPLPSLSPRLILPTLYTTETRHPATIASPQNPSPSPLQTITTRNQLSHALMPEYSPQKRWRSGPSLWSFRGLNVKCEGLWSWRHYDLRRAA